MPIEKLVIGHKRFVRPSDALDSATVLAMGSGEPVDIERVVDGRRELVLTVDFKTGSAGYSAMRAMFRRMGLNV
jgi:hypothetical protein